VNSKKVTNNFEEKEFLKSYNIEMYDRPSITTDIVAFKIRSKEGDTYRHNAKSNLSILLVRRGEYPFKDKWALPGGFLRKEETIEECAYREIKEETGVLPVSLMPIGVFSDIDRDPRGRIVSNAYLSIISDDATPFAGTDATEAKWFDVSFEELNDDCKLTLSNENIVIECQLKKLETIFKKTDFGIINGDQLAFDHARIISTAIALLRESSKDYDLILDFLPEKFTLTELQNVTEAIMNVTLTPANFRRKVSEFVMETDEQLSGVGHRPAKLFKRK